MPRTKAIGRAQRQAVTAVPRGNGARLILVKRATEGFSIDDGLRVLVDRRWPPGLSKDLVRIDLWLKEAGPSEALRRWCRDSGRWESFAERYRAELAQKADLLRLLDGLRRTCRVTLVHGARDTARNNAVVLRDVIAGLGAGLREPLRR
jgi:uncharacterized protein YeaO (DUF488 family)